jgi:alkylation response protein AidB-like acyl-CoA dehydrogenase
MKDTGWLGLLIDQKFGGMGLDCLHRIVNVEHLARECPNLGAILQIAQLGTGSILEFGSDEQKLKRLPQLASGERVCIIL